jgi:hypothetical protein
LNGEIGKPFGKAIENRSAIRDKRVYACLGCHFEGLVRMELLKEIENNLV